MRRLSLVLMVVLCMACAADPEPAADAPAASTPAAESAAAASPEPGTSETPENVSLVGGTKVGKVKSDDWKRVDRFTAMLYAGELETLHGEFSEAAKQELDLSGLTAIRDGLLANHGEEVEVVGSTREEKEGYRAYKRAARFSKDERLIEVAWVIGPDDEIAGLFVTPDRSGAQ